MGLEYGTGLLIFFNFSHAGIHLLPLVRIIETSSTKKVFHHMKVALSQGLPEEHGKKHQQSILGGRECLG